MNKFLKGMLALGLSATALVGCSSGETDSEGDTAASGTITVVSREDGSGTRGAFTELMGIDDGEKDNTTSSAQITNSTSVMMTTVEGNDYAIGYISLGSLNDTVKAVTVDGVEATAENVENGEYAVSRPFLICTTGEVSELGQDFMNFILSDEGQAVVEEEGYIPMETTGAFTTTGATGDLTVGGSSSVTPVMEKLAEAYQKINTEANISVQQSDSTSGAENTISGVYDIGMCSRNLTQEEQDAGLTPTTIALDGIAVIVNKNNSVDNLASEQIKQIYTGEITDWADVAE